MPAGFAKPRCGAPHAAARAMVLRAGLRLSKLIIINQRSRHRIWVASRSMSSRSGCYGARRRKNRGVFVMSSVTVFKPLITVGGVDTFTQLVERGLVANWSV